MQVTFLMPVYNAEQWLDTSVGSLLAQTSRNWQLVIATGVIILSHHLGLMAARLSVFK